MRPEGGRRRHFLGAVTPTKSPIASRATRRRSVTTASARQGVTISGMKPRQSRTPAPSMTMRATIGQAAGPTLTSAARSLSRALSAISLFGRPERGPKPAPLESLQLHGSQVVEARALIEAAQRLADKPAHIVELGIVRRERSCRTHHVERIEDAAQPVGVLFGFLTRFCCAVEALGGRIEAFLFRGQGGATRFSVFQSHFVISAQS